MGAPRPTTGGGCACALLQLFGTYRLDEIDSRVCEAFKEAKLREAEELRAASACGAELRDERGRAEARADVPQMDELAAFLDSAAAQDAAAMVRAPSRSPHDGTASRVAQAGTAGLRPRQIAAELELAPATVSYHLRRLRGQAAQAYVGRRGDRRDTGRSVVRVSELCDLRVGGPAARPPR